MSNVINITELKRKEIRREFENGVVVKNPTKEQRQEIVDMFTQGISADGEEVKANITGEDVLLKLMPMLTNVDLGLEDDSELLQEILDDPSETLLEIQDEIGEIIEGIVKRFVKTANKIIESPELMQQIGEEIKGEEVDPKQAEIEEMERKLKELKGE